MAYHYMAVIQSDAGDYFGSNESSLTSLKFLNKKNHKSFDCLSSNYNELGVNNLNLKNYDDALRYYDLAIQYSNDQASELVILNNKALVYREKQDYLEAIKIYNQILPKNEGNNIEHARALSNITLTKWLQDPRYHAASNFLKALQLRERSDDLWGQNSSYSHLSDYYSKTNTDSALFFAQKMYTVAKKIASPDDQLGALQKLINLSPSLSTKRYFEIYQQLNDSVTVARSAAKNQFALIRYESEKNFNDNLKLQKENTDKKYELIKQQILLFLTCLVLVSSIVTASFWFIKRKKKLTLESQNAIRNSQLKTSKRIHDVVANGLYRIMTEIENQNDIEKEYILDKIEDLYEKSRDISYENYLPNHQPFNETISTLLQSFATSSTKILIAGNAPTMWLKVNHGVKFEIEHIIQELMVNMRKHSGASNVGLKFKDNGNQIDIYYTDNGIGLSDAILYKNGLKNTGNRIEVIKGAITFDTKLDKGLKIHISFPVS